MKPVLTPYKPEHFSAIRNYFPTEWNFDFNQFILMHLDKDYFRGFSLLDGSEPIGFGNLMVFGTICWIGNIVVSEKHRKKGFGTKITEFLIRKAGELGANTFNLVATELGEPIYRTMGFETECMYEFYALEGNPARLKLSPNIRLSDPSDIGGILNLDYRITRERRDELIHLFPDSIQVIQDPGGKLEGYFVRSLGDGFIGAENSTSGIELLNAKLSCGDKKIVVPSVNSAAKDFVIQHGFEKSMELPRMTLGKKCNWKPGCIYSRGTGYCG